MTYIEFADKYLTPPERTRFLRNYRDPELNFDLMQGHTIDREWQDRWCMEFLCDSFNRSDSPEGWVYWKGVIRRIKMEYADDLY